MQVHFVPSAGEASPTLLRDRKSRNMTMVMSRSSPSLPSLVKAEPPRPTSPTLGVSTTSDDRDRRSRKISYQPRQSNVKTPGDAKAGIDWKKADLTEVAAQLTLADYSLLKGIHFSELLFWLKPKLRHQSPHVQVFIDRFNKLGSWVSTLIVTTPQLKYRARLVSSLISLAKTLESMNNLNAVMAILGGLNSNAVHRLKFTFDALSDYDRAALASLSTLMDTNSSFANYRKRMAEIVGSRIPYLGVLIQDLLFVDEGSTDVTAEGLINFRKRRRMASYLQELKMMQNYPHKFQIVADVYDAVSKLEPQLSEKDQYNESLAREPRQAALKDILQ